MNRADADFALLRIAQLKGMAQPDALRALDPARGESFEERWTAILAAGWLQLLPRGARVTPMGAQWLALRLREEREASDHEACRRVYEAFTPLNQAFKQVIYDWQIRESGGKAAPNDHQDAAHDAAVIDRLARIHAEVQPILDAAASAAPRLEGYRARFAEAIARCLAGEHRYVAAPLADSYHTIWFELHEDLLSVAGLSRNDEARAGRAD